MDDLDLDIDSYNLHELLGLFKLTDQFTPSELKQAKRMVLSTHPDKSGLDKKYFLFFSRAYKLLVQVNDFKTKSTKRDVNTHLSFQEMTADGMEPYKQKIIDSFSEGAGFNQKFNELFDKHYIKPEEDTDGHGEWLSSKEPIDRSYENRKKQSRALTANPGIDELSAGSSLGVAGLGASLGSYSAQGQYDDVKSVYTHNSVIGVSEEDFDQSKQHGSIDTLRSARDEQDITPMDTGTANRVLREGAAQEDKQDTVRAFNLVKEGEANKTSRKNFWGNLLQLHN
jgi:hypothetical protein